MLRSSRRLQVTPTDINPASHTNPLKAASTHRFSSRSGHALGPLGRVLPLFLHSKHRLPSEDSTRTPLPREASQTFRSPASFLRSFGVGAETPFRANSYEVHVCLGFTPPPAGPVRSSGRVLNSAASPPLIPVQEGLP